MAKFDVTAEDVARGTILRPGWYRFKISKVEDKPAKTDGSPVTFVTCVVQDGKDHQDQPAPNVPVLAVFSVKAAGSIVNFYNAFVPEDKRIGKGGMAGVSIDDRFVGKEASIYVVNDQYEGRTTNKAQDFRPLS